MQANSASYPQLAVNDRVAWSVRRSVCHSSQPCKNGLTDRDTVWIKESGGSKKPYIRWVQITRGKGQF